MTDSLLWKDSFLQAAHVKDEAALHRAYDGFMEVANPDFSKGRAVTWLVSQRDHASVWALGKILDWGAWVTSHGFSSALGIFRSGDPSLTLCMLQQGWPALRRVVLEHPHLQVMLLEFYCMEAWGGNISPNITWESLGLDGLLGPELLNTPIKADRYGHVPLTPLQLVWLRSCARSLGVLLKAGADPNLQAPASGLPRWTLIQGLAVGEKAELDRWSEGRLQKYARDSWGMGETTTSFLRGDINKELWCRLVKDSQAWSELRAVLVERCLPSPQERSRSPRF